MELCHEIKDVFSPHINCFLPTSKRYILRSIPIFPEKNSLRLVFHSTDKYYEQKTLKDLKKYHISPFLLDSINLFSASIYYNRGIYQFELSSFIEKSIKQHYKHTSTFSYLVKEEEVFFIFEIKCLRKIHSIYEFNYKNYSKPLFLKYIKICKDAFYYIQMFDTFEPDNLYINLTYHRGRRSIDFREMKNSLIFLRKEVSTMPQLYYWIPTEEHLRGILKQISLSESQFLEWRKTNKISIKCEELNLLMFILNHIEGYNSFKSRPFLKLNDFITLKLVKDRTEIYIKGDTFLTCKKLLYHFPSTEALEKVEIDSIDELRDYNNRVRDTEINKVNYDKLSMFEMSPEEEFWGHCSNLQAWVENDYDTRILDSRLSFPLLHKLSQKGDKKAKLVFKDEIKKRIDSNYLPTIQYLIKQRFYNIFSLEELFTIFKEFKKDGNKEGLLKDIHALIVYEKQKRIAEELKEENISL